MMNQQKKIPNKNELLEWLNQMLKSTGTNYYKIEQLGTGVAYLNLLNSIHPGSLEGIKYNKKPANQYEYYLNLKILVNAFGRLGIDKVVEIQKLSKLKMQDNLAMLQWFYTYYNNRPQGQKSRSGSLQQKNQSTQAQVQPQKKKLKIPQKLNLTFPDKSTKRQMYQHFQEQLKSTTKSKIRKIQQVIRYDCVSTNDLKLQKIADILGIKNNKNTFIPSMTPIKDGKVIQNRSSLNDQPLLLSNNQNLLDQNLPLQRKEQIQKKQVVYQRPRRLQQRYQQYIKAGILKKNSQQQLLTSNISKCSKQKRHSVRLNPKNQIFEYSLNQSRYQNKNLDTTQKLYEISQQNNSVRQTDNSMLLQSDRKSNASETNLLPDE